MIWKGGKCFEIQTYVISTSLLRPSIAFTVPLLLALKLVCDLLVASLFVYVSLSFVLILLLALHELEQEFKNF